MKIETERLSLLATYPGLFDEEEEPTGTDDKTYNRVIGLKRFKLDMWPVALDMS